MNEYHDLREMDWNKEKLASSNYFELAFDSNPQNESFARVAAAAFMTQINPTLEEVDDVKTAVSEAVTNCVIHGYGYEEREEKQGLNSKHPIRMECFFKDKKLYIKIEDFGVGIVDIKRAMEPLYTSKPNMDRSGMGFAFMEAFMDELFVESKPMAGTKVYMSKQIGGQ